MPRELAFFDHLLALLARERQTEEARFAETRKNLTAAQRVAAGDALRGLVVTDESVGLGGRILLTLAQGNDAPLGMGLDPGACVALRPHADAPESARAVVTWRKRTRLQVAFEQPPPPFVTASALWLELLPNDVSYQRAKAATTAVRDMAQGRPRRRRDVLLGQAPPRSVGVQPLLASQSLNPEQQDAVQRALACEDFFLVHGPPGTGKSTVLGEVAVQLARQGHQVLATAASNAAVDHLLAVSLRNNLRAVRVGHPARVAAHLQAHSLDALVQQDPVWEVAQALFDDAYEAQGYARRQRKQGRSRQRFDNARGAAQEARSMIKEARALMARVAQSVLDDAQVICATCTGLGGHDLAERQFDWVLFDEATQATEPVAHIVYTRAERVIMAGDPCQLSPTVIDARAAAEGLATSLFERLLQEHGDGQRALLREQYRMHQDIMAFASASQYGGALRAHASVAQHTLAALLHAGATVQAPPILWVDTAGMGFDEERPQDASPLRESLCNPGEADIVVKHAQALLQAGLPPEKLGVISPYRAQVRLLREALDERVEVDTVDAFQGREKEAILLSLTRSNSGGEIGFLRDERRLNVALTRARRHLMIAGDSGTLAAHPRFAALLSHVEAVDGYRSGWVWDTSGS